MHKWGAWLLLVWGLVAQAGQEHRAAIRKLLEAPSRPTAEEVLRWPIGDLEAEVGSILPLSGEDLRVARVFRGVVEHLQSHYRLAHKLLFARDCEFLFDAAYALVPPEERARWTLVPISRSVSKESTGLALERLLARHGMPLGDDVAAQSTVWLDTGARGTIYNHLFAKLLPRREHSAQIALARSVVPLLLQSRWPSSQFDLAEWLMVRPRSPSDVQAYVLEGLRYAELDHQLLSTQGIPSDFVARSRWLVDYVEHSPKWTTRVHSVTENGELQFEGINRYTGNLDRRAYLRYQARILRHFWPGPGWPGDAPPADCAVAFASEATSPQ